MQKTGVSIIVCCHNSVQRLPAVIESLIQQRTRSCQDWEILVVDNNSTDNTFAIAESYISSAPCRLRVISEERKGLVYAREAGIREATYAILSFVDDDNVVAPSWVEEVFVTFQSNPKIGACGGIAEYNNDDIPQWFRWHCSSYAIGPQGGEEGTLPTGSTLYGAGLSLRADVLRDLSALGFQPNLTGRLGASLSSGEDTELILAMQLAGWAIYYNPRLRLEHRIAAFRVDYAYLQSLVTAFGRADAHILPLLSTLGAPFQRSLRRLLYRVRMLSFAEYLYRTIKAHWLQRCARVEYDPRKKSWYSLAALRTRGMLAELKRIGGAGAVYAKTEHFITRATTASKLG